MTRWWVNRVEVQVLRSAPGYLDVLLGEFIATRFPKRTIEIRQIIREDGTLIPIEQFLLALNPS